MSIFISARKKLPAGHKVTEVMKEAGKKLVMQLAFCFEWRKWLNVGFTYVLFFIPTWEDLNPICLLFMYGDCFFLRILPRFLSPWNSCKKNLQRDQGNSRSRRFGGEGSFWGVKFSPMGKDSMKVEGFCFVQPKFQPKWGLKPIWWNVVFCSNQNEG